MANRKSMAVKNSILTLWNRGWSQRRIARELCINRETVSRYVRLEAKSTSKDGSAESKPAIPPPGSSGPKPAIPPPGSDVGPGRRSRCEPYREQIEESLKGGLTAQRIYQDLVVDYGFDGSYTCVKRFVRKLKGAHPRRIWRIEVLPGEEAQIDFGTGAWLVGEDGRKRRSWIIRVTLSFSRKSYSEAVLQQTTETFIRCLENAFREFGGVPETLLIDNLRAAVTKADWYEPEVNPKIESFCRHYGTVILPARARKPEHKGYVAYCTSFVV